MEWVEWGSVPDWIEALGICAIAVEVYVSWHKDPNRPAPWEDKNDD